MVRVKVLRCFFWVAFAVFLTASIPHIAYFFRAYEPQDDSAWYWLIAYGIAISIDITTFLLSLTVAELRQRQAHTTIVTSVWGFIALLAAFSWFVNWEYATQFQSSMLSRADRYPLVLWVGPIMASCFQILAIAYTWISDKIAQERVVYSEYVQVETPVNSPRDEQEQITAITAPTIESASETVPPSPSHSDLHIVHPEQEREQSRKPVQRKVSSGDRVTKMIKDNPQLSNGVIAKRCNVSRTTVFNKRKQVS